MMSTCFAYVNPPFQPAMRIITAITQANPASVTTSFAHLYKSNLIVRLDIPPACGMQQINGMTGTITVTSPTTFLITIDSTLFSPFAIPVSPPANVFTCAQVVPIGEDNGTLSSAVKNTLPHTS
jgi:hypothetical protein